MPVTIDQATVTVAIRAATSTDQIPAPIAAVMSAYFPASVAIVEHFSPGAPDDVLNAAVIRLAGWLYDTDPTDPQIGQALTVSGARALLARWRNHRAAALEGLEAGETPVAIPGEVPSPPANGTYVLVGNNGGFQWIEFPLPE